VRTIPQVKISVIAPNLNEAEYLPSFLKSLEKQTFKNWELIVVDGGSTDESLKILREYGKAKIIVDRTRNIGYVRNLGAKYASGNILFHTSSDVILPENLLEEIAEIFEKDNSCIAVSGRTLPQGTSFIAYCGYICFDIIRWLFTRARLKFRPSGNFCAIRRNVFNMVGGFPEVKINEDGLFGCKIDGFCRKYRCSAVFRFNLTIRHYVKRFEKKGGLKALLFYLYVFANMFPILKFLFKKLEYKSGEEFASRSDLALNGGKCNGKR